MPGIYTLKVQTEFSAAHALRGYVGDCARIHGHNWKVEIEITAKQLNEIGLGVDFKDIKRAAREVIDVYEHQYLNEIPPFDTINPTAENIVELFYRQLKSVVNDSVIALKSVTLWETDRASVKYSED